MFTLHGNGVGTGIAIGTARILRRPGQQIPEYSIESNQVIAEIARLERAIENATTSLQSVESQFPADGQGEVKAILGVHLLMLQDPSLAQEPMKIIQEKLVNAEAALKQHGDNLDRVFSEIDDPYLRGKSADVAQVISRIHGELLDDHGILDEHPAGTLDGEVIVANDLAPADTIELKRHRIGAFLTNLGGPISHTAILARSMKIPAIVGLHGGIRYLRTGDLLIIDGKRGVVLVNPDKSALEAYGRRREKILRATEALESLVRAPASTLDGVDISLSSNIELPEEVEESTAQNAAGIGLYRTEFLFMNRDQMPDEEEQYDIYSQVIRQADKPVTIRTLDLGADKQVDGGRAGEVTTTNPALGRRAIRLCLHDIALFKPQLRAIYRAAVHGDLKMMIPMVSSMDELDQLFHLLSEVRQELRKQGYDFNPDIPVGGMVEVPAAAVAADLFAHRLDFLSIGTNDLIQYTLAIDRIDDEVNYLYDPLHPSVLRLIRMTLAAGEAAGIPVSMCGEMAGDTSYTRILLGMGLRDFSMDPAAISRVKQHVRLSDVSRIEPRVNELLKTSSVERIRELLEDINA